MAANSEQPVGGRADLLVVHGTVVTMDEEESIYEDGYITVKEGVITDIGNYSEAVEAAAKPVQCIDAAGTLVIPGLINAHTHAAMTLFRGMADDLDLNDWLQNHIFPAEAKYINERHVRLGTELAIAEMLLSGTTTFNDMYFFEETVARAAESAGMRAVVGECLFDFPAPNCKTPEAGLRYSEALIQKWKDHPLVTPAVSPHSLYACSAKLLKSARALADKYDVPYHLHVAETVKESDDCMRQHGKTPVEYLEALGVLNERTVAAHCVHVTERDIAILAEKKVKVAHLAASNLKLASGIPPITELLADGICIGMGTDGAASNNNLDMFEEMDLTAKIHKVVDMNPTSADARTVLRMATVGAADALGLGHMIGSLEKGKKADISIIDGRQPHMVPLYHPLSQLVYAAEGGDVRDVVVNGRIVVRNRILLTMDAEDLMNKVQRLADKIQKEHL
jgi:5-methylthioadenosine/S-adenosylhomocysteine deaminase